MSQLNIINRKPKHVRRLSFSEHLTLNTIAESDEPENVDEVHTTNNEDLKRECIQHSNHPNNYDSDSSTDEFTKTTQDSVLTPSQSKLLQKQSSVRGLGKQNNYEDLSNDGSTQPAQNSRLNAFAPKPIQKKSPIFGVYKSDYDKDYFIEEYTQKDSTSNVSTFKSIPQKPDILNMHKYSNEDRLHSNEFIPIASTSKPIQEQPFRLGYYKDYNEENLPNDESIQTACSSDSLSQQSAINMHKYSNKDRLHSDEFIPSASTSKPIQEWSFSLDFYKEYNEENLPNDEYTQTTKKSGLNAAAYKPVQQKSPIFGPYRNNSDEDFSIDESTQTAEDSISSVSTSKSLSPQPAILNLHKYSNKDRLHSGEFIPSASTSKPIQERSFSLGYYKDYNEENLPNDESIRTASSSDSLSQQSAVNMHKYSNKDRLHSDEFIPSPSTSKPIQERSFSLEFYKDYNEENLPNDESIRTACSSDSLSQQSAINMHKYSNKDRLHSNEFIPSASTFKPIQEQPFSLGYYKEYNEENSPNDKSTLTAEKSILCVYASKSLMQQSPNLDCYTDQNNQSEFYNSLMKSIKYDYPVTSPILGNSKQKNKRRSNSSTEKKQVELHVNNYYIDVNSSEHNSSQNVIIEKSALVKDAYYYKKRYKECVNDYIKNTISTDIIKTDDCVNRNMNLEPPDTLENFNSLSPEISVPAKKKKRFRAVDNIDKIMYVPNDMVQNLPNLTVIKEDKIVKNSSVDNTLSLELFIPNIKKRKIDFIKDEKHEEIIIPKNMIAHNLSNSIMIDSNVTIKNDTVEVNSSVIESVSSCDSTSIEQTESIDFKSDDEETLNNLIEDTEEGKDIFSNCPISESDKGLKTSAEVIEKCSVSFSKYSNKIYAERETTLDVVAPFKMKTIWASTSLKDSDETFYSKAESMKSKLSTFQNDHALENISRATTFSNESIDNKSNQTNCFISTATSPEKTSSNPTMSLQILDSCKKRRRRKTKSLTTKLQSLINRQTSFVRIWHHQINQEGVDSTSIPHVDVYVDKCTSHLHRQFLDGFVLNDPFNLLNDIDIKEKSNYDESSHKMITMIIVPEIVGKFQMKSESIVKIFPPWDIIDSSKLILNVTYIKIISNKQGRAIFNQSKIRERKKEKVLLEESQCLCLETNKLISSCNVRLNHKMVAIKEIFNF